MKKILGKWNDATDFDRKVAKGAAIGSAICAVIFVAACANGAKKRGAK